MPCSGKPWAMTPIQAVEQFVVPALEVFDYGRLDVVELVQRVRADDLRVLLISVLMLPSALKVRQVRDALGSEIRIAVGGAPFLFDAELWKEVGADATRRSAAVAIVNAWMGEMQ